MNVFGMGTLEVLAILLVAFIVLGPRRMVDAARLLGKATREVRRLTEGLPDLVLDEDLEQALEKPIVHRGGGPSRPGQDAREGPAEAPESMAKESEAEGPVAFRQPGSGGGRGESPPEQGLGDT